MNKTSGRGSPEDRERLASSFDAAADLYHLARPEYPKAIYDHLLAVTQLWPSARPLEIGAGTGKATLPLAQRGFHITARSRGRIWQPPPATTSPTTTWRWSKRTSRTGGHHRSRSPWSSPPLLGTGSIPTFATARPPRCSTGVATSRCGAPTTCCPRRDPFFEEIQEVFDEIGEGGPPGGLLPRPGELADFREEIDTSGVFTVIDVTHFDWETMYDADGYIRLLQTFSGHIVMHD